MNVYNFKTDQFGLNADGLHLLRSGYCYRTLPTDQLQELEIKKGVRVKNRLTLIIFGLINLSLGVVCFIYILPLNSVDGFAIKGAQIVWAFLMIILVLWFAALVSFYQAFIKTTVLIARTKDYWNVFSLYSTVKNNELDNLINFLKNSPLWPVTRIK
ncbi:hypothetical protein E1176_01550 [Fulvivirga sp. RKSG066]|uniref:hypothetical protein n=1 Tax=Fulvivirga aurantia TaxID=2529383 RepID=UPI001CA40687|nr:hypothetical protein [Fulvivirga aurantia]MTI19696.1 hypothetical protein [Fulvivirga aurantia]